jgi:hypothetical protein
MFTDQYGLPVQSNQDANDQLQRVGMIAVASVLTPMPTSVPVWVALEKNLQPSPGVFSRFTGGQTNDVSADQLISALGAFIANDCAREAWDMLKSMIKRYGFAQNTVDGLGGSQAKRIPDLMFFRAMPLFCRMSWLTWPFAWIFDLFLVVMVLGDYYYKQTDPDPADCIDTVLTLAVCRAKKPTLISWYCCQLTRTFGLNFSGRLTRYFRPETGANQEIAAMWQPICRHWFE